MLVLFIGRHGVHVIGALLSQHFENVLSFAWPKAAHVLQTIGRMRRLIASIQVHTHVVHRIYELDVEQAQKLGGVLAISRPTQRYYLLLHGMKLERENVSIEIAQL